MSHTLSTLFTWAFLVGGLLLAIRSWFALADQPFVPMPRAFVVRTYSWRRWLHWTTLTLLFAGVGVWATAPEVASPWAVLGLAVAGVALWAWAFYATTVMFRSREAQSRFVAVAEAEKLLRPDDEVMVLEIRGEARAYTDVALLQPHVAGTERVGGEDVTMTYCGLSHLGVAYTPVIDGQRLDLHAINQVENNLILLDRRTGSVVQQIYGHREGDSSHARMREWPTRRMSLRSFTRLYPEGRVFTNPLPGWRNPLAHVWDAAIQIMMRAALKRQERELVFPTGHVDPRLPSAAKVSSFHVGDDHVAYTEAWVRAHGGVVNVEVGGRPVVVAWDEDHQILSAFYNDTGRPIEQVDPLGDSPAGRLPLVESWKAGVYWGVVSNFVPSVDLNRPGRPHPSAPAV